MPLGLNNSSAEVTADRLAGLLHRDIRQRGLRKGDRYLTDKQAAEFLQVGHVTAHRAMRLLASRNVIVRRQRAGTFVGPQAQTDTPNGLRCVHFLMPHRLEGDYPITPTLRGLRKELPSVQVQINFVDRNDPLRFLRQMMDQIEHSDNLSGIVTAAVGREVRRFFNGSNLPVAAVGHVEPDIDLPWVARDQRQIGRLLAQYMVDHGHQRILLLMRDHWSPSDNLMAEGVEQVLRDAQVSMAVRSVPYEPELIAATARDVLAGRDRPTGLICGADAHAVCAAGAAEALGLTVPGDLEIAVAMRSAMTDRSKFRFPYVPLESQRFGELFGRMFAQWHLGRRPDPNHYEISVRLVDGLAGDVPAEVDAAMNG